MIPRLVRLSALLPGLATCLLGQYQLEPTRELPSGIPKNYTTQLSPEGYRMTGPAGPWAEVWFRTSLPAGPKSSEEAVSYPTIPAGAFLGIVRFPGQGADRRGQPIKAGVYTMRYANYPANGDHMGVAPQRDFAVLTPLANDPDPSATPGFDQLMEMSRKASGSPHPAVLSIEQPPQGAAPPAVVKDGEKDWTLAVKVGSTPLALILVGHVEG